MFGKISLSGTVMMILGVIGLVFDAGTQLADFVDLPAWVSKVIFAVSGILSTMGLREVMLNSKEKIRKKVVDFTSQTFWGSAIAFTAPLFVDPSAIGIENELLRYRLGAGNGESSRLRLQVNNWTWAGLRVFDGTKVARGILQAQAISDTDGQQLALVLRQPTVVELGKKHLAGLQLAEHPRGDRPLLLRAVARRAVHPLDLGPINSTWHADRRSEANGWP